ncbi:MAG: ParB N-terminal domain-containing protein [bacterium]|nr:ParB N-terminal domain-containing protein [bacterium]
MKIKISEIIIKDRIREDRGDISGLKASMQKNGLLNPIVVSDSKELLAGFRRLEAAKELGWEEINCTVVMVLSELDKLDIEADENLLRKGFNPDEMVKMDERREYLEAKGFKKFMLWLKKLINSRFSKSA